MKFLLEVDPEINHIAGDDQDQQTAILNWVINDLDTLIYKLTRYHEPLQEEKTKEYPEPDKMLNPNMMLYVGGSKDAYRCPCGANVFSQKEDEQGVYYECHGCWTVYREGK